MPIEEGEEEVVATKGGKERSDDVNSDSDDQDVDAKESSEPWPGGFTCEFVEKPPKLIESECPVCLQIIREPYQVICCGCSFCRVCIERLKTANKHCPTCNEESITVFPDKRLQRSLYDYKVYCTHRAKGCKWTGELRQLEKHLNEEPQGDRELEGCLFTQPVPLSSSQASFEKLRLPFIGTPTPPVTFTLTKYAAHKRDDTRWWSPPFYTHHHGYKMCLSVYPNGRPNTAKHGTHVTVFILLKRGEFDDGLKWPFRGDIMVSLLDQEDNKDRYSLTINFNDDVPDDTAGRVTEGNTAGFGWGSHGFIPHNNLQPKYLKNDCLVFQITNVIIH